MEPLVRDTQNRYSQLRPGDTCFIRFDTARETHYVLASRHPARMPETEAIASLISVAGYFRVNTIDVIKVADRTIETMEIALGLAEAELRRYEH